MDEVEDRSDLFVRISIRIFRRILYTPHIRIYSFIRLLILYLDGIESPKHFFVLKILKNNGRLSRFVLDLK